MAKAMTIRVYTVDSQGRTTRELGKRSFSGPEPGTATSPDTLMQGGFPPCMCYLCRAKNPDQ